MEFEHGIFVLLKISHWLTTLLNIYARLNHVLINDVNTIEIVQSWRNENDLLGGCRICDLLKVANQRQWWWEHMSRHSAHQSPIRRWWFQWKKFKYANNDDSLHVSRAGFSPYFFFNFTHLLARNSSRLKNFNYWWFQFSHTSFSKKEFLSHFLSLPIILVIWTTTLLSVTFAACENEKKKRARGDIL